MSRVTPLFGSTATKTPRAAIFMSGSGTNASRILEHLDSIQHRPYDIVVVVTDRPHRSNAQRIAEERQIPLIANDIQHFYAEHGCPRVTIATPEGRQIREAWTDAVRAQLAPYAIDFALFAGFVPLTNIAADFPCLNVHPGDLTYRKLGARYLVGLHTIPIERAMLEGLAYLRSTVLVVQPYQDSDDDMDTGPILGISEKVPIDFLGYELEQLRKAYASRSEPKSSRAHQDPLREVAEKNQERLKVHGDWVIFPRVAEEFALGRFGVDADGTQYYRGTAGWMAVSAVIYGVNGVTPVPIDSPSN